MHVVVVNEGLLRRQIARDVDYYHESRCHLSPEKDSPEGRATEPRDSEASFPFRWSGASTIDTTDELCELG